MQRLLLRLSQFSRSTSTPSMIGQKKISSFFKQATPKTTSSTGVAPQPDVQPPPKKIKLDKDTSKAASPAEPQPGPSGWSPAEPQPGPSGWTPAQTPESASLRSIDDGGDNPESAATTPASPPRENVAASPLSPEQKSQIAEKQLGAKLKLTTKNTNGLVRDFGLSWYKALQAEFTKPYFLQLAKFVEGERQKGTVFPPPDQVFTFTRMSDIKEVKVIIIGQDPYHGTGQAHGLSFSVQKGIRPPPSLLNMYKELSADIEGFEHPGHGNLTGWAEQGVLMLNACLTVKAHQANSHQGKGWEKFTDAIISWLNKNRQGLVFVLWGGYAQKKGAQIDKKKHLVLKGVHPSPLSAHRGWSGCKHFSKCNKYLKEHSKKPIDWKRLPEC